MKYALGVDLGTTFTGIALAREGHAEMISLGENTVIEPTAVFVRDAGPPLTGDAALRRALGDPTRISREFKRRLGDPTPLILGGLPHSPSQLMAVVLSAAVTKAVELYASPPSRLVMSHPAVWGPYRQSQFAAVPVLSGFEEVVMVPEPVAAATYYAANRTLAEGDILAVYDLGGGTFDATVAQMRGGSIEVLGDPEGVEWLGGIDFDEAVFNYVDGKLDGAARSLDPTDPQQAVALFWLRQECVLAKEALSVDESATVRAFLPGGAQDVVLTRARFEELIRPTLESTVAALGRALNSADVQPADLRSVLLVGGSSRIPLVSRLVEEAMQRPTAVNLHPKHAVALGAALIAARALETGTTTHSPPEAALVTAKARRSGGRSVPPLTKVSTRPDGEHELHLDGLGLLFGVMLGLIVLLIAAASIWFASQGNWRFQGRDADQNGCPSVNCSSTTPVPV